MPLATDCVGGKTIAANQNNEAIFLIDYAAAQPCTVHCPGGSVGCPDPPLRYNPRDVVPITPAALLEMLQKKFEADSKDKKDTRVFINADKLSTHGMVIDILDKVRQVGIKKVSFSLKPGSFTPPTSGAPAPAPGAPPPAPSTPPAPPPPTKP